MPRKLADHLDSQTLGLYAELHREFHGVWRGLIAPHVPEPPAPALPEDWRLPPVPDELRGRTVELVVTAGDDATLREGLARGADTIMLDFDDTFSPTRENVLNAYAQLRRLGDPDGPLLMVRTRPHYLPEYSFVFEGEAVIASLLDLSVFLAHQHRSPLYLYLPKLERLSEARFWNEVLGRAEAHAGLAPGTVRVCLQIETWPGVLLAEQLLFELRSRAFGLNAGRWDYVFSLVKHFAKDAREVLPERARLGMDAPCMQAYARRLPALCARRGGRAVGGSAALAPDARDPAAALGAVTQDKRREAEYGYEAAWAGLPALIPAVREAFSHAGVPGVDLPGPEVASRSADVAALADFPPFRSVPLPAVRESLGIALDYFAAWHAGRGVIVREGRIEDTATAELARAQLWQWVYHRVPLTEGGTLTPERYCELRGEHAQDGSFAVTLLDRLVLADECADYFPLVAADLQGWSE